MFRAYSHRVPHNYMHKYACLQRLAPFPGEVHTPPPAACNRVAVLLATYSSNGVTTLLGTLSLYAGTDERQKLGAYEIWDTAVLPEMYDVPSLYRVPEAAVDAGDVADSPDASHIIQSAGLRPFDIIRGLVGLARLLFGSDITLATSTKYFAPFVEAGFVPLQASTLTSMPDVGMRFDDDAFVSKVTRRASITDAEPTTRDLLLETCERIALVQSAST
jgi:hypothetical protein